MPGAGENPPVRDAENLLPVEVELDGKILVLGELELIVILVHHDTANASEALAHRGVLIKCGISGTGHQLTSIIGLDHSIQSVASQVLNQDVSSQRIAFVEIRQVELPDRDGVICLHENSSRERRSHTIRNSHDRDIDRCGGLAADLVDDSQRDSEFIRPNSWRQLDLDSRLIDLPVGVEVPEVFSNRDGRYDLLRLRGAEKGHCGNRRG